MAYTNSQINRIGNTLVYLTSNLGALPKTKLLKLIYILEEESVLKSGQTFTDLNYQYWTQGPVATFINKQIDKEKSPIADFIVIEKSQNKTILKPKTKFDDAEFSHYDIELMNDLIKNFGNKTTNELIEYTHRDGSLWDKKNKEHSGQPSLNHMELNLLELLNEVNPELKASVEEATFFKEYLTKSNA